MNANSPDRLYGGNKPVALAYSSDRETPFELTVDGKSVSITLVEFPPTRIEADGVTGIIRFNDPGVTQRQVDAVREWWRNRG